MSKTTVHVPSLFGLAVACALCLLLVARGDDPPPATSEFDYFRVYRQ